MKKTLTILTLVGVFCLGALGALAVVPHAHGQDLDHSSHESCPVHQFGLGSTHADVSTPNVVIALFLFSYLIVFQKTLPVVFTRSLASLRGPPSLR